MNTFNRKRWTYIEEGNRTASFGGGLQVISDPHPPLYVNENYSTTNREKKQSNFKISQDGKSLQQNEMRSNLMNQDVNSGEYEREITFGRRKISTTARPLQPIFGVP